MNKMIKLMMVGALVAQVGMSWGMREEQTPLIVKNEAPIGLTLYWTYIAPNGEETRRLPLESGEELDLETFADEPIVLNQIVSIGFRTSWGKSIVWDRNKIYTKAVSGVIPITLKDIEASTFDVGVQRPGRPMASEQAKPKAVEKEKIPEAGFVMIEEEEPDTIAVLNWFPNLKNILTRKLGRDCLAAMTLGEMDEEIRKNARKWGIDVLNFFPNLPKRYTAVDIQNALEILKMQLKQAHAQMRISSHVYAGILQLVDVIVTPRLRELMN